MKTITKEHGVVMLATEVEKLCKKSYNHGLRSIVSGLKRIYRIVLGWT